MFSTGSIAQTLKMLAPLLGMRRNSRTIRASRFVKAQWCADKVVRIHIRGLLARISHWNTLLQGCYSKVQAFKGVNLRLHDFWVIFKNLK